MVVAGHLSTVVAGGPCSGPTAPERRIPDDEHLFATMGTVSTAVQATFDDLGTPLRAVTFVVVDVETTGGSPATSSLTEIAAARYRGGELLGTFQTLVRPDEPIPPFITALTGISDATVAGAPPVGAILPSFLEFVGGAVLVGHNVRFDRSFLDHALVATGRERLANTTVDTLALARRLVRDQVPDCKLGTLATSLALPHRPSHRALADVLATGDLLHALLERAGSYGIVGLAELLDLPRLVGHPQSAKLTLTVRLPHRPGVYWFTDAAGTVLYVGKATDLQARVRSYFTADRRPKVARLLRQLHAVHHRECPGPLAAAVLEGRLIRQWAPPYNQQGKVRRPAQRGPEGHRGVPPGGTGSGRRRGRRTAWTAEQLAGDPMALLAPLAESITALARAHRFEQAARVRDEAERLRHLLVRSRLVESLRAAGSIVLDVEGEGTVLVTDGLLRSRAAVTAAGTPADGPEWPGHALPADDVGCELERAIVAQWIHRHADGVRVVDVGAPVGIACPARRIPPISELCGPMTDDPDPTAGR